MYLHRLGNLLARQFEGRNSKGITKTGTNWQRVDWSCGWQSFVSAYTFLLRPRPQPLQIRNKNERRTDEWLLTTFPSHRQWPEEARQPSRSCLRQDDTTSLTSLIVSEIILPSFVLRLCHLPCWPQHQRRQASCTSSIPSPSPLVHARLWCKLCSRIRVGPVQDRLWRTNRHPKLPFIGSW